MGNLNDPTSGSLSGPRDMALLRCFDHQLVSERLDRLGAATEGGPGTMLDELEAYVGVGVYPIACWEMYGRGGGGGM